MNDNTILRIKVPAHLYESVKEQLTINEAKKSGKAFGDWKVVKEKKAPKDGMKKVEEADKVEETNQIEEKDMAQDKISKVLSSSQVGAAVRLLNAAISNRQDWAKVVKGIAGQLSKGEGPGFDKSMQSNPNALRANQQLTALSGEKIKEAEHKVEEADLIGIGSQIIADPAHAYDILKTGLNMTGHELDSLLSGIGTILGLGTGAVVAGVKDAKFKKAAKNKVPAGSTGNL